MAGFANRQRRKIGAEVAASPFSPSLYGEVKSGPRSGRKANCLAFRTTNAGRAMRGGADFGEFHATCFFGSEYPKRERGV